MACFVCVFCFYFCFLFVFESKREREKRTYSWVGRWGEDLGGIRGKHDYDRVYENNFLNYKKELSLSNGTQGGV